jgi:GntR family transcriptional regulator, transcriptional repressor for pyruvate dehydrogenase complex
MASPDRRDDIRFEPIQARRAFQEVAEQIRGQLESGLLRSGDRLPSERELAQHFQVSRNTLREALRSLEMMGLVELRKGATGGAFIRGANGEAIVSSFTDLFRLGLIKAEHLTEARIVVGVAVARLASERRSEADLEALRRNVEESEAAVRDNDLPRRGRANLDFHRLLARATGNPMLIIVTDSVVRVMEQLIATIGLAPNKEVMPTRRRLLQCIEARDAEGAAREMAENLRKLQRFYLDRPASALASGQKNTRPKMSTKLPASRQTPNPKRNPR